MVSYLYRFILPAAFDVLPAALYSTEAEAMLLATALQESKCAHRRQGGSGPARGFWQFETGGVHGVQTHKASAALLRSTLTALCYSATMPAADIRLALEHNDVLACVLARLLLWTLPTKLPGRDGSAIGWAQYADAWRPGKPRPADWPGNFTRAWNVAAAGLEDS